MFNKKQKELKNNSDLKVQLEMIKEQQRILNTMKNSYNSISYSNPIY